MPQLLWDASGLVKRYINELGNKTVNAIFAQASTFPMRIAFIGYAETAAILRRKRNQGLLMDRDFQQARLLLQAEVLLNPGFNLLTVTDKDVLDGMALTDRHNINSTDAALLAAYLRFRAKANVDCLLIASDKHLIRAAEAEGLSALNPETVLPADLPMFLAG